ncbi:hypothetical protein GH714_025491 [Hevea brasiliensis]|uniref:Uncharacterized protein n=1 Tax=Hevea brasiliensis TaxID=3981 RepID=A0A6A6N8V7_HEVBR|nr:hypothetical protein GH714_025491 [Hevea brasiliensis]
MDFSRFHGTPLKEVADLVSLKGGDTHDESASHGVLSGAYLVAPLPPSPAPTITPPIPPATPHVPPLAPLIPPTTASPIPSVVLAIPFQLNPNLGAFVAVVTTCAIKAPRSTFNYNRLIAAIGNIGGGAAVGDGVVGYAYDARPWEMKSLFSSPPSGKT